MARYDDVLDIGSAPSGEECAQVGEPGYYDRAQDECRAYRAQLLRLAAAAGLYVPSTVRLVVKGNGHDFGTYFQVAVRFDPDDAEAADAAVWFENNQPGEWDAEARAELGLPPALPPDAEAYEAEDCPGCGWPYDHDADCPLRRKPRARRGSEKALTQLEFRDEDVATAREMAAALGYTQTAYTTSSALWGLFCLPDRPGQRRGCVVRTRELGLLFVQDADDVLRSGS